MWVNKGFGLGLTETFFSVLGDSVNGDGNFLLRDAINRGKDGGGFDLVGWVRFFVAEDREEGGCDFCFNVVWLAVRGFIHTVYEVEPGWGLREAGSGSPCALSRDVIDVFIGDSNRAMVSVHITPNGVVSLLGWWVGIDFLLG